MSSTLVLSSNVASFVTHQRMGRVVTSDFQNEPRMMYFAQSGYFLLNIGIK